MVYGTKGRASMVKMKIRKRELFSSGLAMAILRMKPNKNVKKKINLHKL
jgi:hypothetical protein